jgi:uncharacterized membrane protein YfcA
VGTSLIIIAMNSLAGLLGHLNTSTIDVPVILVFVISGFAGAFAGARLARIVRPEQLRTSFAIFVVLLGAFLLFDNISKLMV